MYAASVRDEVQRLYDGLAADERTGIFVSVGNAEYVALRDEAGSGQSTISVRGGDGHSVYLPLRIGEPGIRLLREPMQG